MYQKGFSCSMPSEQNLTFFHQLQTLLFNKTYINHKLLHITP